MNSRKLTCAVIVCTLLFVAFIFLQINGLHVVSTVVVVFLVAAAACLGLWFSSNRSKAGIPNSVAQRDQSLNRPSTIELNQSLERLGAKWVPTLCAQITTASNQMETSISELTYSFSGIHQRLSQVTNSAREAVQLLDVTDQGNAQVGLACEVSKSLQSMLHQINSNFESNSQTFNEFQHFIESTKELKKLADGVEELAKKTNLLALNAAIEAARAGENGRGFSIVADEVRKLSMLSAETGQKIKNRVNEISAASQKAAQSAEKMKSADMRTMQEAGITVNQVIDRFKSVTEPLKACSESIVADSKVVTSDLNKAVVNFQFQDRVSQILAHVKESLIYFKEECNKGVEGLDVDRFLADLESRYTMAEERVNHGQESHSQEAAEKKNTTQSADDDLIFF